MFSENQSDNETKFIDILTSFTFFLFSRMKKSILDIWHPHEEVQKCILILIRQAEPSVPSPGPSLCGTSRFLHMFHLADGFHSCDDAPPQTRCASCTNQLRELIRSH